MASVTFEGSGALQDSALTVLFGGYARSRQANGGLRDGRVEFIAKIQSTRHSTNPITGIQDRTSARISAASVLGGNGDSFFDLTDPDHYPTTSTAQSRPAPEVRDKQRVGHSDSFFDPSEFM